MSIPPDPDSSALLSTMAGAGATLVAIVGGLLVSRYVSLDSEQQGAIRRLEEVTNRLTEATQERDGLRRDLDRENVEEVLRDPDVLEQLVKEQAQRMRSVRRGDTPAPEMTVQDFLDTLDDVELLVTDVVAVVLEEKRQAIRDALDFLRPVMQDQLETVTSKAHLLSWSDVRRVHELRPERDGTWEYVWDEWLIPQARRKLDQRRRVGIDPYDLSTLIARPIPPVPTFYGENSLSFEARLFRAQGKMDDLRGERRYAQAALDAIGKPRGLRVGLLVLALLTLTQVIPPLLFLAPSPAWLTLGQAVVLISLFVAGLVALFWYLIHYALRLGLAGRRVVTGTPGATSDSSPSDQSSSTG